jgi:hypothetical protein
MHIKDLECKIFYIRLSQNTCLFLYYYNIKHIWAAGAIIKIVDYFLCTTN